MRRELYGKSERVTEEKTEIKREERKEEIRNFKKYERRN